MNDVDRKFKINKLVDIAVLDFSCFTLCLKYFVFNIVVPPTSIDTKRKVMTS